MEILQSAEEMTAWSHKVADQGKTIALVPTMGFFHEGHLQLMREGLKRADLVVVSLFVNPTQFGPNEDLDAYPRDFERDRELAADCGVAALFAPTPDAMYPEGFCTSVSVSGLTTYLCGVNRPTHFAGVTTVVSKLFNIVQPDTAIFGEKDFQQVAVIRRLVKDMNIPVDILAHPIVREEDGLAMSSRNARLNPEDRASALTLSQGIQLARDLYAQGERQVAVLEQKVRETILAAPKTGIDYVSFVHCETLESMEQANQQTVLALAVKIDDKVRLIDNGYLAVDEKK